MRSALIAAVYQAEHGSNEWAEAVRALGRWRKQQDAPPKRSRSTGLSRGELFDRMLRSHVFDADRKTWQQRWWNFPNSTTFDSMKAALDSRKSTEKMLKPTTNPNQPTHVSQPH